MKKILILTVCAVFVFSLFALPTLAAPKDEYSAFTFTAEDLIYRPSGYDHFVICQGQNNAYYIVYFNDTMEVTKFGNYIYLDGKDLHHKMAHTWLAFFELAYIETGDLCFSTNAYGDAYYAKSIWFTDDSYLAALLADNGCSVSSSFTIDYDYVLLNLSDGTSAVIMSEAPCTSTDSTLMPPSAGAIRMVFDTEENAVNFIKRQTAAGFVSADRSGSYAYSTENIVSSSYTITETDTGKVIFYAKSLPKAPALSVVKADLINGVLSEAVSLLPVLIPVIVSFISLRKGIAFVREIMQSA